MVFVNDFKGADDSEIINNCILNRGEDGIVVISARDVDGERDYWLLDRAILLPQDTTVILRDVKLKLSDRCRDNFFRSANCGFGIDDPQPVSNIHIIGEGVCILEGADHPRATGDSSKLIHMPCPHFPEDMCKFADWVPAERRQRGDIKFADIHDHTYGTDAQSAEESNYGDWRGIGILLANVNNFSISGICLKDYHCWGISLEACSFGKVENIRFDAHMHKLIDGMNMNMENQDGIDLRNGCHHIEISDITGCTGDDVVALTAIAAQRKYTPGGSLRSTHVMHNDWSKRETGIHDVIIRNISAHSYLCWIVRLLPALTQIYNVTIDGVYDTRPDGLKNYCGVVLLGDNGFYGENLPDSLKGISVSNVKSRTNNAVYVEGFIADSVISKVSNNDSNCSPIKVCRDGGCKNVKIID